LNVWTTPEFITWLDRKMATHGQEKLIPPDEVIAQELEEKLADDVRKIVTERILREAGLDRQVAEALDRVARPTSSDLVRGIKARPPRLACRSRRK
jgi:hypothetical protein